MQPDEQYRENFIIAMFRIMAQARMNQSEFAAWLGVSRVTVYKITERKQLPTPLQGITLCRKAGIDANWLFLNEGTLTTRPIAQIHA